MTLTWCKVHYKSDKNDKQYISVIPYHWCIQLDGVKRIAWAPKRLSKRAMKDETCITNEELDRSYKRIKMYVKSDEKEICDGFSTDADSKFL